MLKRIFFHSLVCVDGPSQLSGLVCVHFSFHFFPAPSHLLLILLGFVLVFFLFCSCAFSFLLDFSP